MAQIGHFHFVPADMPAYEPAPSQNYAESFNFLPVETFHDQVQVDTSNFQFVPVMTGVPMQQETEPLQVSNALSANVPFVKPHRGQILTARDDAGNKTFRFVPENEEDEEDAFNFAGVVKDDQGENTAVIPSDAKAEKTRPGEKINEIGEKIMSGFSNSLSKLGSLLNIFSLDEEDEAPADLARTQSSASTYSVEDGMKTDRHLVVTADQDGGGSTMVITPDGTNLLVPVPNTVKQGGQFIVEY